MTLDSPRHHPYVFTHALFFIVRSSYTPNLSFPSLHEVVSSIIVLSFRLSLGFFVLFILHLLVFLRLHILAWIISLLSCSSTITYSSPIFPSFPLSSPLLADGDYLSTQHRESPSLQLVPIESLFDDFASIPLLHLFSFHVLSPLTRLSLDPLRRSILSSFPFTISRSYAYIL